MQQSGFSDANKLADENAYSPKKREEDSDDCGVEEVFVESPKQKDQRSGASQTHQHKSQFREISSPNCEAAEDTEEEKGGPGIVRGNIVANDFKI